ncbi:serine/threonine-protein kinase [Sorangium sp. So ce134]
MVAAPVAVGDVLAGKYRVEQIVGAGAMGTIVAAWHLELDQRVAMKFLHSRGTEGGDPAERFRREARALARIKSEHVARVLDVGSLQDGMPYMVMEFLEGNNLADEIRARGALPVVEAVGYALQAIEAMAEAHAAGIVHRDLKPANLFLARRPDGGRMIKVLDFGISKSMLGSSRDELALTKTATLLGSPLYMSPEQVRCAKDVDARTDVWALGVIVYEMLTGRTPYNGDSVPQLFASLLHETPPTMAQVRADVPRELDAVVMHCLAKDPEQRWRNVGDLAHALLVFGPAGSHVHVERARRVLGLPGAGAPSLSRPSFTPGPPDATLGLPGAITGAPSAGSRLSIPQHGGLSPAASAETGPAVSSWSNTGNAPRAGRKGALVGVALAAGAALASLSLGAVLFLLFGTTSGGGQPPAPAATQPSAPAAPQSPGAAAAEPPATAGGPAAAGAASAAVPEAAAAPEPPASAALPQAAAAAEPPAPAGSPAAPAASSAPAPAASRPAAPPASAAARPQPGPGAHQEPRRTNTISDFGGRR